MSTENTPVQVLYKLDLSGVASLTFLVWDILITLDQEAEAIWTKPNKFYTKWLFLFVRYFAVAMQIAMLFVGSRLALNFHYTESDCVKWYIFQEVGTLTLIAAVESVLIVRVHALYDRSRIVTSILVLLFIAENVVMIVTLVKIVPEVTFDGICTVVQSPPRLLLFAVAFFSFESVLFFLTLFKFIVALRHGWGRTPVLFLLVRDGTWVFILIFVTLCVNAGFYLGEGNTPISSIAFPWLLSIEAFAGARLVLNLHALPFDDSAESHGSRSCGGGGMLSSHIVFTPNMAGTLPPTTRWDWGGIQEVSSDGGGNRSWNGIGTGTRMATGTLDESYEMTWTNASTSDPDASFNRRKHRPELSASTSGTNCTSHCAHCIEIEEKGVA